MTVPSLSVLMPAFNAEPFVRATLDAVLSQLPPDGEVVACDNASTDGTYDVLVSYAHRDPRVRAFRNDSNVGSVGNANACLARARSEWAMFVCSDDLPAEGAFAALLEPAQRISELGLVFGTYLPFEDTVPAQAMPAKSPYIVLEWPRSFSYMVEIGNPVPFSTALFRTDLARKIGGFRPDRLFTADYRFWLALCELAPICRVDRTTMYYRLRAGSESDPQRRAQVGGMIEVHLAKLERWASLEDGRRERWERMWRKSLLVYLRALWVSVVGETDPSGLASEIRHLAATLGSTPVRSTALLGARFAGAVVRSLRRG